MAKHLREVKNSFSDRLPFILTSIIFGLFIAFFAIPNTSIREPNPEIFTLADTQRSNFFKFIQFYYNSGQWEKIQKTIDDFKESNGDMLRNVYVESDRPISNAVSDSKLVSSIKPISIEETRVSKDVSSYIVKYSFTEKGFKRFGLKTGSYNKENLIIFKDIKIISNNETSIVEGTLYQDNSTSRNFNYLFTYEVPEGSNALTVQFLDSPSYDDVDPLDSVNGKVDIYLSITPGFSTEKGEINFVLNNEKGSSGFRNKNIYTINDALFAGICTDATLTANPNIFLQYKIGDSFSFQKGYPEEKFIYKDNGKNFLKEIYPYPSNQFDVLGIKDYGTTIKSHCKLMSYSQFG